jgi:hypothetical protein
LPESAARELPPDAVNNIGDWPISTDWKLDDDHSQAFAAHWREWEKWFRDHREELDEMTGDDDFRGLLRVACEAMRQVELTGQFDAIPKTTDFKVIIAEHDEPNELSLERYGLFTKAGTVRCHGDPA